MIKKILVSQPKPSSDKSPYYDIAKDLRVELLFRPFIRVVSVSNKEFREQKVNFMDHTAVVFTSRHAIDNYFKLASEMHVVINEDMKYFCVTDTIALYIQKYAPYRKRKVFFGKTGRIDDLIPAMQKHKQDRYLVPMSSVHDDTVAKLLSSKKIKHSICVMYRTVSNNFTDKERDEFDCDMCVFFSPSGVEAFQKTFQNTMNDKVVVATFGPATTKAAHEAGLKVVIEAPSKEHTSMTGALRAYLESVR